MHIDAVQSAGEHFHGAGENGIEIARDRLDLREARKLRELVHQPFESGHFALD